MMIFLTIFSSALASILLISITQTFTSGRLDVMPMFFVFWGILLATFGIGADTGRIRKALPSVYIVLGVILLSLAVSDMLIFGYRDHYLNKAIAGSVVTASAIWWYRLGGRDE